MSAVDAAGLGALGLLALAGLVTLGVHLATGVPPTPARAREVRAVCELARAARLPAGARVYELGAGWGTLAVALARALPEARVVAIELSPVPFAVLWLRARRVPNLTARLGDFRRADLSDADLAAAYLMIGPMAPLAEKLDRELREGTPVIALCFHFRGRAPEATAGRLGRDVSAAALYRWPAKAIAT